MPIGQIISIVFSFILIGIGFCVTLHLAARYVLGPIAIKRAAVAIVPAFIVFVGTVIEIPVLTALVALIADFLVIRRVYDLENRLAGYVTVLHVAFGIIVAFTVQNIVFLLGA